MAIPSPYENYKTTQINTASPVRLIVLLCEGAVSHIRRGEALIADPGAFAEAGTNLLKAMNIVSELLGCLNPNASKEISEGLSRIYSYVIDRIGEALQNRDPAPLAEAARIMTSLGSTWKEVEAGPN